MTTTVRKNRCATCSGPKQDQTGPLCNSCWEVESRLDRYADSAGGRRRLLAVLHQELPTGRAPFVSRAERSKLGSCMNCAPRPHDVVLVFNVGSFQARLCLDCSGQLARQLQASGARRV